MTPEALAALHARAAPGRAWSAAEFAALLAAPGAILSGSSDAFALGRLALDEAELLMLATGPDRRRQGLGRAALDAFHAEAAGRGARRAFLEVAADNAPARALYAAAGYAPVGRRPGYYGPGRDALILARPLGNTS